MAANRLKNEKKYFLPEHLKISMIYELGKKYLDQRRRENHSIFGGVLAYFHHNQHIAMRLCNYNEFSLNHYHHWRYLAEIYRDLKSASGDLGDAIIDLFKRAFNQDGMFDKKLEAYCFITDRVDFEENKDFEYPVPVVNQKTLSEALHYFISGYYVKEMFDEEHKNSRAIKPSSVGQAKKFISLNALLADIKYFDDLTVPMLNQIGRLYLDSLDLSTLGMCSSSPVDISAAQFLADLDCSATSYECWMLLAQAYARLFECTGELSAIIMTLYKRVFDVAIGTLNIGTIIHPIRVESESVALAMKGIVNEYYERPNRVAREMQAKFLSM